jgi:hypothetical protein
MNIPTLFNGEPEENFFEIFYLAAIEFNPFGLEHVDFSLNRASRCLSLKPPNPTG